MIALLPFPISAPFLAAIGRDQPPPHATNARAMFAPYGLDFDVPTAPLPLRAVVNDPPAGTAATKHVYTAPRLRYSGGSILPDDA
jgi:hypothetical protein